MPVSRDLLQSFSNPRQILAGALLIERGRAARECPNQFIQFCFTDHQGQPLRQSTIHRELQAFLSGHSRALIELPRDHGKSVQVCARVLWELGHNPGLRVKFVCATDSLARERSRFLREAIAGNPRVRLVFPQLRPAKPWAMEAFTIIRPAEVIGPTVAAFGIGSGSTGARADLLICDDIVDVRSLHSRRDRQRVIDDFHNNVLNLLEPDGRFWGLCTPWHAEDLNARLKLNPAFAVFRRAIDSELRSIWPEKWPQHKLRERRQEIGEAAFARGYRLLPVVEEERMIRSEWIQFWHEELALDRFEKRILSVDPALSVLANADASAFVILGRVAGHAEIRCLDAVARRVAAPELVEIIDDLDRRWQVDVILFESNAAFSGIRDLLIRQTRFGAKIQGIIQTRSKLARIAGFSLPVQNGLFRLKGSPSGVDPSQRNLYEEMSTFPFAAHDDLVDAAATGCMYLLDRPDPRVWL